MPKDTPSMAKNKIRRSLLAILDPHPSCAETEELWSYFRSHCAYCGVQIERASRNGHLDHVIPATAGGGNDIHNFVLSCARCNGDEKREENWRSFLSRKAGSLQVEIERAWCIEEWLARANPSRISAETAKRADVIIAEAVENYEQAVVKVRLLRNVGA